MYDCDLSLEAFTDQTKEILFTEFFYIALLFLDYIYYLCQGNCS